MRPEGAYPRQIRGEASAPLAPMNAYLFEDVRLDPDRNPDRNYQPREYTRSDARDFPADARQLLFNFTPDEPETED